MAVIQPEFFCELPRYQELRKYRLYLDSKQYEGRADFFTGQKPGSNEIVPLRERKPCVIYPLPSNAVKQVVRFTFGESRFPTVNVSEIDPDQSVAGEKLSKDDAEAITRFISELIDRCALKPTMRRIMRPGVALGTSALLLSLENGLPKITVVPAEDMLPEFRGGSPLNEVTRAVWCYQYMDSVPDAQGKPESKRFWFRQDITDAEFIEFERVEVLHGERPVWRESRRIKHDFGFCPVLWIRNVEEEDSGKIDGCSLFEDCMDHFDALNFALSQRHRGINFFGVPQAWETGVEEDDGPAASGRVSRGYGIDGQAPPHGRVLGANGRPARPISPNQSWTYRSKDAKVGLLETTGKAFESASLHVNDIRSRALEAMSVVLVNVSEIMGKTQQGQMSAKFLELAYEPLLALVDEMRHCWWPNGLQALLSALLRIVVALKGEGIYVPGAKKAAAILSGFMLKGADGKTTWMPPKMTPTWGDYFSAGPDEITQSIDAATKAKDARLVPEKDAAKYVLHYFGREDTDTALEEIEDDKLEAQAQQVNQMALEQERLHTQAAALEAGKKPPPPVSDAMTKRNAGKRGGKKPGGAKPPKAAGGGGGGPAATSAAKE